MKLVPDRCRMEIYHFGVDWGPGPRPAAWDMSIELHDKIWHAMKDEVLKGYAQTRNRVSA